MACTDVVAELLAREDRRDVDGMVALLHDDATLELPFAPGGPVCLEGAEAVRAALADALDPARGLYASWTMRVDEIAAAAAPGLVFARYAASARTHAGTPYDQRYVGRFEVRDGRVATWCEWFDPAALERVLAD